MRTLALNDILVDEPIHLCFAAANSLPKAQTGTKSPISIAIAKKSL